jgi:hypothetical protein
LCHRSNHKALLACLHELLAIQTTAEVFDKFKALVDYLSLPDPAHKLLPPPESIPIGRLPVLDLHFHAMAKQAVDVMLGSDFYVSGRSNSTWTAKAAYFMLMSKRWTGS